MKTCLREESIQAYLDGELPPDAAEAIRGHLAECAGCAAARIEMEQTLILFGAAIHAETPETVPTTRLRAGLEARLRELETPRFSIVQFFWRFGLVAAAALILVGLAGWLLWRTQPSRERKSNDQATAPASVSPPEEDHRSISPNAPPARRRIAARRRPGKEEEEEEVVTDFFSLREGEDLRSLDSLQLVRIEVPSSALGEVGLPVDPETRNEPIKADVVLGQDGMARAIRFVR